MDDLEGLIRAIEDGDVHLASEATIGAYGILTRDKHTQAARPVLISGSCKCETALEHAGLIQTTVDALDSQLPAVGLKLVSIASDGEQKCGKALVELTFKYDHPQDEELYNLVKSLQFMDLHVGDNDVMADKDGKHIDKRLRNASLRESGMFIHGYLLTPSTIHKHLCMAAFTVEHIKAVMNPNDKQDVKLAYDLLRDVWTPKLEPENITPGNADAREAIYTFGSLCFWLIYPYICVDLSLAEQLKYLSAAAHLAFALYRDEKAAKKFLPTTLYVDIQIMIKNVFFCVAKAKRDDPDGEFFIILLGTDRLEILFGIVRTLVANNCNLDILQLADRLNGALEVANILALHPEWDKTPRRLKLPMVTRDDTVISTSTDHITPEHWCGCLRYKLLSLLTLWNGGRKLCEDEFPWTRPIFESAEMEKASFLSPLGKLLVTEPLDPDDIEEEYNFPEHFATKHPTVAPAGYQSLWAITDIEKELMHDIWKGRHQVVKRRKGKKKSGPPLPISEAHSSRNAIRHDVNIDEEEERLSTEDSPDEYESDESTISNDSPTSPHPVYDDSEEEQETSSRPKFQDDEEFNDLYLDFDDDVRYLCRDAQTQPEAPAMEIEKDAPPAQEDNPACTENETPRKRQLEEDEPEEGRRTRRRTVGRLLRSTFHVCHCGDAITEEEKAEGITVVRCKRLGCETEWMHLSCLIPKHSTVPKNFICDSCKNSHSRL
uniref:Zinc finger PHD-type domain-containing protein n=1 Tax=Moniliophthora roreri TaxID=221103 RepID=A0A0W0FA72_MONRR